jgi:hypothetical protein
MPNFVLAHIDHLSMKLKVAVLILGFCTPPGLIVALDLIYKYRHRK